jgi:hypothetical protein
MSVIVFFGKRIPFMIIEGNIVVNERFEIDWHNLELLEQKIKTLVVFS